MKLRSIEVTDFGTVASAKVELRDGLNVLYGPNDLGKSTMAAAVRAALLLQHGSSAARPFVPWGTKRKPQVAVTLEIDGRLWRVHKVFGTSSGGKSVLEWSNDGDTYTLQEEGRGVDGKLRELLGWGLAAPGGRGGSHGFPKSFLATVLLGEQAMPYRLLGESLQGDAEDTGKARLVEALQAMATDPVYMHVLEAAQAKVDEAFTARGKRSTRKGSPFERVSTEIRQRRESSEALAAQVAQSEAVVARLGGVVSERDRLALVAERTKQAAADLEQEVAVARRRKGLEEDLAAAQAVMTEIEHNRAEIDRLFGERQAATAAIEPATAAVETAAIALRAAHAEHDRAAGIEASVSAGTDLEGQEETRALDAAVAEARTALAAAADRAAALATWKGKREARETAEAAAAKADADVQALADELAAAKVTAEAAAAEHAQLRAASRLAQRRKDADRLERWQADAAAATARAQQAADKRSRARQQRQGLAQETLPSAEAREALHDQWDAMRLGEAALGGGVSVELALAPGPAVQVSVDEGALREVGRDETIEAAAQMRLAAGELGSISVRAGDPGARAAFEEARQTWTTHAVPLLEAAGVADLEALEQKVAARAEAEAEAAALEQEAAVLEAVVAPAPEVADELRTSIARADAALDGFDPAALERRLDGAGPEELVALATDAEAAAASAARAVEQLRTRWADAGSEARVCRERVEAAVREETSACPPDTPDAFQAWEAAAQQQAKAAAAVETAVAARDAATQRQSGRLRAAQEAAAAAAILVESAAAADEAARAALAAQHQAVAAASAALDVRKEQSQQHDALAAAERLARAQDALNAAPPEVEGGLASLEAAAEQAGAVHTEAVAALDDAETAVRQQQGALQTVGGQVVRERAQLAVEALDNAQREEAELALDYDGWRLLLGTLREVENQTGAHLGRALGGAVAERFESLSGGRYQGASLGADLETQGVLTPDGIQQLDRFSEGVKEQLATLLRVSVAEQLGSMLLLDDHLAQTDPARSAWFRDLLLESAKQIQLVVLTCRPADYPEAGPAVHRVDLEQGVQRFSREREA